MTAQLSALPLMGIDTTPPLELLCCDVAEMMEGVEGARLVHADPPWSYSNSSRSNDFRSAAAHFDGLSELVIGAHLSQAYSCAAASAYMVVWCTFPKLAEWMAVHGSMPWRYVTGGVWAKTGRIGVGFHTRGNSEIWLLYVKGSPRPLSAFRNEHRSSRGRHSEKPHDALADLVSAYCPAEGLVLDLYAGFAPLAHVCRRLGRAYRGAELDPKRHAAAMAELERSR